MLSYRFINLCKAGLTIKKARYMPSNTHGNGGTLATRPSQRQRGKLNQRAIKALAPLTISPLFVRT